MGSFDMCLLSNVDRLIALQPLVAPTPQSVTKVLRNPWFHRKPISGRDPHNLIYVTNVLCESLVSRKKPRIDQNYGLRGPEARDRRAAQAASAGAPPCAPSTRGP